ncbi:MAG: hypothetical protein OXE92_07480 [Bacteroidetes bacterium]|nr:hypothetical protein [Bacteroidota bacterium]
MSKNPDVRFVRDYLSKNPGQLHAALAVHDAWPLVRDDICKQFLEHLCKAVDDRIHKEMEGNASNWNVYCRYVGDKPWATQLFIRKGDRARYDDIADNLNKYSYVALASKGLGPKGWHWGVVTPKPMNEEEEMCRENLSIALKRHGLNLAKKSDSWPQWEYLSDYQTWDIILPELVEECKRCDGSVTKFYVDGLLDIARRAIPAINEVEMVKEAK